ncbi:MAG: Do family serine endopeptidase [Planctomycetes bacterium]|jgi:serine protease Do|nr:Do family serine endopeptidase [Planctomycetota bacterium]
MKRWIVAVAGVAALAWIGMTVAPAAPQAQSSPAPVRDLLSYRDIVKKALPAVVSIESRQARQEVRGNRQRRGGFDLPPGLPEEFRRRLEEMMPEGGPEAPDGRLGSGSGVVVDASGVVLTNHHVVDGAGEVTVLFQDGRKVVSKSIVSDPKTDLAIVRLDASKGPYAALEMGDSDSMEIGDRVIAVGAPFGLAGTVTHGIVSAKNRNLNVNMYEDFIQTDAAINPGNSGGPLLNIEGQVIGINSAIKSRTGGFQGIGLAIPSNLAKSVKDQLLANGGVKRSYIGVAMQSVQDPALARKLGLPEVRGAVVNDVVGGAPAEKAGLQPGDVIVGVDGKPVKDSRALQAMIASQQPGREVSLDVVRDGKNQSLKVKLEEQPKAYGLAGAGDEPGGALPSPRKGLGLSVADMSPEVGRKYGFKPKAAGVIITEVEPRSPAAEAGLRPGMLITRVERKPVPDTAAFEKAVSGLDPKADVLVQAATPDGANLLVVVKGSD